MLGRQRGWGNTGHYVRDGCARLAIRYTNGMTSGFGTKNDKDYAGGRRSSSPSCLPEPGFDGGREEVRCSVKIIQSYGQSWLSEKPNCFFAHS